MNTSSLTSVSAAMVVLILAGWENAAFGAHERLYAITTRNNLVSFYSDAPGNILTAHAITGLQDGSEKIRGIDSSTNDHKLYGLGSSSRLYVIDPASGAATQVGAGQFSPVLNGQSFGVDNGPSGFYVASDLNHSLVIHRATGVATVQPSLAYGPGDPHVGQTPRITGLAYDDATGNWYAGDSLANSFATLNPTTGVLNTIGASGIDFSRENGLDISPTTGIMYLASPAASSDPQANLYTVNKATGAVTLVGQIGNPGDNILLRGLAVSVLTNQCPTATAQNVSVAQNSLVNFQLQGTDADTDPIHYLITSPPAHGSLVVQQQTGAASYRPTPGYCGADSFNFKVNDGGCDSAEVTVVVVVAGSTPPQIVCPANLTVEFNGATGAVVTFSVTATDPCCAPTVLCVPPSGSTFAIGTNTVLCTATNCSGNRASCGFTVTVEGGFSVKQAVLAELIALRATVTGKPDTDRLDDAIHELTESLDPGLWVDETHLTPKHGEKVFQEEKDAVKKLRDLARNKKSTVPAATLNGFIARLVQVDRLLAVVSVQEVNPTVGNAKKIAEDWKEITQGDDDAAAGRPDDAMEHYRNAWKHAVHLQVKGGVHTHAGVVLLRFVAFPGGSYVIQASANLQDWTVLGSVTADADGMLEFEDRTAAWSPTRYYRVMAP